MTVYTLPRSSATDVSVCPVSSARWTATVSPAASVTGPRAAVVPLGVMPTPRSEASAGATYPADLRMTVAGEEACTSRNFPLSDGTVV